MSKKPRYKDSWLREVRRYDECNTADSPGKTDLGIEQFYFFESRGIRPDNPDPYFIHLCDGKAWWEWTLNFIAATYMTWEWCGWYQYAKDFASDPAGYRQLRLRCGQSVEDPIDTINTFLLPGEVTQGLGI